MAKVEFIYDLECPNVDQARSNLVIALNKAKHPAKWKEWDRNSEDSPDYAKEYGSPTILVDGKDIVGSEPQSENNCRIYSFGGSNSGVPPVDMIASKLNGHRFGRKVSWKAAFAAIPGIGLVLLPKLTCAACWPAYAAIMSSMGVGFFNYTDYLFPISLIALLITLVALGFRAKSRRGYGPLYLGLIASAVVLLGKFSLESNPIFYLGVIMLVVSSFWNSWPKQMDSKACSACES